MWARQKDYPVWQTRENTRPELGTTKVPDIVCPTRSAGPGVAAPVGDRRTGNSTKQYFSLCAPGAALSARLAAFESFGNCPVETIGQSYDTVLRMGGACPAGRAKYRIRRPSAARVVGSDRPRRAVCRTTRKCILAARLHCQNPACRPHLVEFGRFVPSRARPGPCRLPLHFWIPSSLFCTPSSARPA